MYTKIIKTNDTDQSVLENTDHLKSQCSHKLIAIKQCNIQINKHANDPSAGSPTETLLRLLLPLSDKAHKIFHTIFQQTD